MIEDSGLKPLTSTPTAGQAVCATISSAATGRHFQDGSDPGWTGNCMQPVLQAPHTVARSRLVLLHACTTSYEAVAHHDMTIIKRMLHNFKPHQQLRAAIAGHGDHGMCWQHRAVRTETDNQYTD